MASKNSTLYRKVSLIEQSITVDRKTGICDFIPQKVIVRSKYGNVFIFINSLEVEMSTILAHKIGMAMVTKSYNCAPSEYIQIKINNASVVLLPMHATQIGGALLRKADDADDFQLENFPKGGYRK